MRTSVADRQEIKAKNIRFDKERMYVSLTDGREIGVPLEWFPKLHNATAMQKKNWRLIGRGMGIHWRDLDEDLSVPALLK